MTARGVIALLTLLALLVACASGGGGGIGSGPCGDGASTSAVVGDTCGGTLDEGAPMLLHDAPVGAALCDRDNGVYCDSATRKCIPVVALGATCTRAGTYECATGAYCDPKTKTCAEQRAAGEPCTSFEECRGGSCSSDKGCRGTAASRRAPCR